MRAVTMCLALLLLVVCARRSSAASFVGSGGSEGRFPTRTTTTITWSRGDDLQAVSPWGVPSVLLVSNMEDTLHRQRSSVLLQRHMVPPPRSSHSHSSSSSSGKGFGRSSSPSSSPSSSSSSSSSPPPQDLDDGELTEERKANLFQFLLRDLQVEGVPLLTIDAPQGAVGLDTNDKKSMMTQQYAILQAALWTTLTELCQDDTENKVCLVLEKDFEFALDDLNALVDDFAKFQQEHSSSLPELERISISLVGQGKVGPAIILQVGNATFESPTMATDVTSSDYKEIDYFGSMKVFSSRLLQKTDLYPYDSSNPITFACRSCAHGDACHILSSFWNCICELTASSDTDIASTILVLPGLLQSSSDDDRFSAITRLVSRTFRLMSGVDEAFRVAYFSPTYTRDDIAPTDVLLHGHLPSSSQMETIFEHTDDSGGDAADAVRLSIDQGTWDYQRRSPVPAIVIKRASLLQQKDGEAQSLSSLYARNAMHLTEVGKDSLETALQSEIAIYK